MSVDINDMTQRGLRAGITWLAQMSSDDKWDLTERDVCILLGGIEVEEYMAMKLSAELGDPVVMASDTQERLGVLLGIWKGLVLFVPENKKDLAYSWFSKPNDVEFLMGKSIKAYLLEDKSLDALYRTRNYLYAQVGAW